MTRHYLDILADVIRENWDKPALTDYTLLHEGYGNEYTFGEMFRKVQWLRKVLEAYGLKEGEHIAICGVNSSNWVIAYLAVAALKGVSVTIMHTLSSKDIVQQITKSDSTTLFVDKNIWTEISHTISNNILAFGLADFDALNENQIQIEIATGNSDLLGGVIFELSPLDTLAQISFTSGSTRDSKGVMLSYRSLSINVENTAKAMPFHPAGIFFNILPLSHVYGLMGVLGQFIGGNRIFLFADFDFQSIFKAFTVYRPYSISLVPMIVERLYKAIGDEIVRFWGKETGFSQLVIGGASMDYELEERLLSLGVPLMVGYGSTETGPLMGASVFSEYKPHSGGRVVDGMQARIAPNGEILVRGENVMLGYYKDPEATAAKIDQDGWLHTGDRGHLDEDGYLYVEGRLEQDMIVLPSGENISPVKVETIINACNGVEESIVLARNGKLIALVVLQTPSSDVVYLAGDTIAAQQNLRNKLLAQINPQLPAYSQLFGLEFLSEPLARTEKKTIKRYLYK